jgi:L-aspartate oxidase
MQADGTESVSLDLRGLDPERFPNVFATCVEAGLEPTTRPVPVAPASHYLIGGIATDLDGATTLPGLLAVGECACTGLHGANRLASNSLSECFVFGTRAARAALEAPATGPLDEPDWRFLAPDDSTREAVWADAGPQRDAVRLARLLDDEYPLARMIAAAALERRESRGAHRRDDFPLPDPDLDGIHLIVQADGALRADRWVSIRPPPIGGGNGSTVRLILS